MQQKAKSYLRNTISSYDKTAKEYFDYVSSFNELGELNEFVNLSKKNGSLLDLGCGPGHHAKKFTELGFKAVGIDLSTEMIKLAKHLAPETEFRVMDMLDLDFTQSMFDSVWASASLIHLKKEDIPGLLSNINELLKSKGIFYFSLKEGVGEKVTYDQRYDGVEKFHSYFSRSEVVNLAKESGFKIRKVYIKEKRSFYDTNSWIHALVQK